MNEQFVSGCRIYLYTSPCSNTQTPQTEQNIKKLMHDSEPLLITFQILCIYNMSIEIQFIVLSLVFIW